MRTGNEVRAVRKIEGGWTTPSVPAGSKGVIVQASPFFDRYTVTFTNQGLLGGTVTLKNVSGADLQRW